MSTSFSGFTPDSTERQVFTANQNTGSTAATSTAQIWRKPKGLRFSSWFLIGAGSGGGNGLTGAANTSRGGGGGGGSGGMVRAIFVNEMLPDELYVFVPGGGAANGVGGRTLVSAISTSIASNNLFLASGAADAQAGANGAATLNASGGAGSTAAAITTARMASLAIAFMGPPIEPRGTAGAAVYCGGIYLFGGESQAQMKNLDDVFRLDLKRNVWESVNPMPNARKFVRAVVFMNSIYIVGGSTVLATSHSPIGSASVERFVQPGCP